MPADAFKYLSQNVKEQGACETMHTVSLCKIKITFVLQVIRAIRCVTSAFAIKHLKQRHQCNVVMLFFRTQTGTRSLL